MSVKNLPLAGALLALFASAASAQNLTSDWSVYKLDPISLAKKSEAMLMTFKGVDGAVSMKIDLGKSTGKGVGYFTNEIRSPKVFRVEYPRYTSEGPTTELMIADGKRIKRTGVGAPQASVTAKDPFFFVSSDATFVESFPKQFARYIWTPYIGGNTTMSRWIALVKKGVGGFTWRTDAREVTTAAGKVRNYRFVAARPAKGKLPASRVELIFDASLGLPVNIQSSYDAWNVGWLCRWRNNRSFPSKRFVIPG